MPNRNPATNPSNLGIPGVDHPDAAYVAGADAPKSQPLSHNIKIAHEAKLISYSLKRLFNNSRRPSDAAIAKIIKGEKVSAQEAQFQNIAWLEGYVKGWMDALA